MGRRRKDEQMEALNAAASDHPISISSTRECTQNASLLLPLEGECKETPMSDAGKEIDRWVRDVKEREGDGKQKPKYVLELPTGR